MKRLTKAEEEIMQIIWELGPCTVSDIRKYIHEKKGLPKPPHSSVSTIVRGLDNQEGNKAFLGFKAYGRTYEYYPLISKEEYSKRTLRKIAKEYFGGSVNSLVSFLVKEEKVNRDELNKIIDQLDDENDAS